MPTLAKEKYTGGQLCSVVFFHAHLSMDIIGPFDPSSKGSKYALAIICMSTGYTLAFP